MTAPVRPRARTGDRAAESGYCHSMAPSRPTESTAATDGQQPRTRPAADAAGVYDPIAEQDDARRARADRDRRSTMAERLQRLHDLCAQLATITPARPRDPR